MDKILTDWYEKGFKTMAEVEAYQSKPSKRTSKTYDKPGKTFDNNTGRTYDAEALKQKLLKKSRGDLNG